MDADAEAILLRVRFPPVQAGPTCLRLSCLPPLQCIESHLKDKTYDDAKVAGWVNGICEDAVYGLIELGKPFKYISAYLTALPCGYFKPRLCLSPSQLRRHAKHRARCSHVHLLFL